MILLDLDGEGPLYRQIYGSLRAAILEGRLSPGSRLPSSRQLADVLRVSRTVVLLAIEQLRAEGYVVARARSGTFVTESIPDQMLSVDAVPGAGGPPVPPPTVSEAGRRLAEAVPDHAARGRAPLEFDFRYGDTNEADFPDAGWKRAQSGVPLATFRYPSVAGDPELRSSLAAYLERARGVRCSPDQIVLTSGAQQSLFLLALLLVEPGRPVALEEPHYTGARAVFLGLGATLAPVEVDERGLRTSRLTALDPAPGLVYVTPSHQFPLGGILSLDRRLTLLEWARTSDAWILEDDYDSEFQYDVRPIPSLQGLDGEGRVVYLGTFSKVLAPSMGVGYVVLPESIVDAFIRVRWVADRHTPWVVQRTLSRFIESGDFETHLRRIRLRHARRRRALVEALEREFGGAFEVAGVEAGIGLVLRLRGIEGRAVDRLVLEAAARGVGVHPVQPYYVGTGRDPGLLLGYGALSVPSIDEGIRRLGQAVRSITAA